MTAQRRRRHRDPGPVFGAGIGRALPYLLLAPGHALAGGVLRAAGHPDVHLLASRRGRSRPGTPSISSGDAYTTAITEFGKQFINSILYGGMATILTLLIGFPVAYTIAFRGGRYKNLHPVPGHRAVLHQLPDPDDQLEDPARR